MPLIHRMPLPLLLHLLRPNLQHPHETNLLLPLSRNTHNLTRLKLLLPFLGIREPATGRSQAGSHQGRTGEHEADGAAVDADCGDCGWEGVEEAEVGDWGSVEGLEEEGGGVYCVEGCAVGAGVSS